MDAPGNAEKPKKKSGYQGRKERAAKAAMAESQRGQGSMSSWLGSPGYRGGGYQFDPKGPPVELPVYGLPPVTLVRAVSNAILQLEQGAFYAAAYLWDGMFRDDRLSSTVGTRIDRLVGSPVDIEPADVDGDGDEDQEPGEAPTPPEAKEPEPVGAKPTSKTAQEMVSDDLRKQISKIMPSHQLYELMRCALGLSVGVAQVLSDRTKQGRHPTFRVWNNRYLRYDWLLRQYRLTTENRGEITLEPGDPEWIIYEPYGPHGWLHGALIRAAVTPWLIRYWVRTWWARHQEVHGQPLRLGIIPADRSPADESIFLSQLSNLAHEAVIRLPQGAEDNRFDVKLLEASANTWEGFARLLQHCDDSFAILFLGQRQSTDGQGGLGATEKAGESTMIRITRKDSLVYEIVREQLIKPWAKDNYGDEELAPYLVPQVEEAEDEKEAATTDLAVAQALVAFKTAGAPIDVRSYLTERGYPLLTEQAEMDMKAKAVKDAQDMMQATTPKDVNANQEDDGKPGTGKGPSPSRADRGG